MARILLIEDSPTEAAVLTQLLEKNGHEVTASVNAEDGIDVCRRERPDLVLMDVILPGMNGFQATRDVYKRQRSLSGRPSPRPPAARLPRNSSPCGMRASA